MKFLLLSIALILSTGCSSQEQPVAAENPVVSGSADVLYHCSYKYDSKYNIEFLKSNKAEYHPPSLPELLVYRITDTHGQHWAINQYDWVNYICTTNIQG